MPRKAVGEPFGKYEVINSHIIGFYSKGIYWFTKKQHFYNKIDQSID